MEVENINGQNLITKIVDFQIINGGETTATLADAVLKKTNVELEGIYVPIKLTVMEDRETEKRTVSASMTDRASNCPLCQQPE